MAVIGGVWLVAGVGAKHLEKKTTQAPKSVARLPKIEPMYVFGVRATDDVKTETCALEFHLTKAKRILASARITEAGNKIHLSAVDGDSYIQNLTTRRKVPLVRQGGVYVIKAMFDVGSRRVRGTIVVDSGAAECVMPSWLFPEIVKMPPKKVFTSRAQTGATWGTLAGKSWNLKTSRRISRGGRERRARGLESCCKSKVSGQRTIYSWGWR